MGGDQRSVLRRKPIISAFPLVAEVRESSKEDDKRNRQIGRTELQRIGLRRNDE